MLEAVYPTGLLRDLLWLIAMGIAFLAGRTVERKGPVIIGRHYAWIVRAVVCLAALAALAFRHVPDGVMIGGWRLASAAFAGGWWQALHPQPPEDLPPAILPRDE